MVRLPSRPVDRSLLDAFLGEVDCARIRVAGENLILNIERDEVEFEDWDDGLGWMAALTPLRSDVLAGDPRMFYLLWLTAVEDDAFEADEPEPMVGIGPTTPALEAFAAFFGLDPDLVQAAGERNAEPYGAAAPEAVRATISEMSDPEKTEMLARLFEGVPHVAAELRASIRDRHKIAHEGEATVLARTVGELRARAGAIGLARERAAAEKAAAKQKRLDEEAARIRRARLDTISRRGQSVWREIEVEIERRNPAGYDEATSLLFDLRAIAEECRTTPDFTRRLEAIRERHAGKWRFIERLAGME